MPEDVKKHADLPVIGVIPVFTTKGRRIGND
jgi:capsular polysaccharide biosynthesis protein